MTSESRILVVEDEVAVRRALVRMLGVAGHHCDEAGSSEEAVGILARQPFDLVLADMTMPGEPGTWLARFVRDNHPDTAVIMVTAVDDPAVAKVAIEAGASGYVIKPFARNEMVIHVANALRRRSLELENRGHRLRLENLVAERTLGLEQALSDLATAQRSLQESHEQAIRRLAIAAEFHDPCTGSHLSRMSRYSLVIATALGLPDHQAEIIRIASPMHDVGKIGIPDQILQKPGRLTADEMNVIRRHPGIGFQLLAGSDSELLDAGAVIALGHHEHWDGSGYPGGLTTTAIPLPARIVALADVFDALTTVRPYKPAFPLDDSFAMVASERGKHFDPDVVDAFLACEATVRDIAAHAAHAGEPARQGA